MIYCYDCHELQDEGIKRETNTGEFWGAKFSQDECYKCCGKCGGTDIDEPNKCPCGDEIKPLDELCENCIDILDDIKKDVRALYPRIKTIDKSAVEDYILDGLWEGRKWSV